MENKICIGKILKPQGIKGEIKAEFYSDNINYYKKLKEVYIQDEKYDIISFKVSAYPYVFISFKNLTDRNMAENLRNKEIFIKKSDIAPIKENQWYINDLIGCEIIINNITTGKVFEILKNGSADIVCAKGNDKTFMFPLLNKIINLIDVSKKIIVLKEKEFSEVVLYEN